MIAASKVTVVGLLPAAQGEARVAPLEGHPQACSTLLLHHGEGLPGRGRTGEIAAGGVGGSQGV
jgi:hypothetical protein